MVLDDIVFSEVNHTNLHVNDVIILKCMAEISSSSDVPSGYVYLLGIKKIEDMTHLSKSTVFRSLKKLIHFGYISKLQSKFGIHSIYTISNEVMNDFAPGTRK